MAKKLNPEQIGNKLRSSGFGTRSRESEAVASDPIADTPMVVTLDQLRPYDKNPRINRNPKYEEIKESIRARGLDQVPGITRRPGEEFFIIRDGGNTRLTILNELWTETRDERFFRLNVLFRPWAGELRALTGHLAENDVRGGLSLIERALGVESARVQYEAEAGGEPISQRELSRRLKADGYPISNSHISRMQDIIRYLLPAIPQILYAGLGIDPAVKLIGLRKAAFSAWEKFAPQSGEQSFDDVFIASLSEFDEPTDQYNFQRVQDELTGRMSDALQVDYNLLTLEIQEETTKSRRNTSGEAPPQPVTTSPPSLPPEVATEKLEAQGLPPAAPSKTVKGQEKPVRPQADARGQPTPRDATSSVWEVEPGTGNADSLRAEIAELARQIAIDSGLPDHIETITGGVGYHYARPWDEDNQPDTLSSTAVSTLMLLESLSGVYAVVEASLGDDQEQHDGLKEFHFSAQLGHLLMGKPAVVCEGQSSSSSSRLSDASVIKLFRMIRLARRLIDIDSDYGQE